jgi:transcriptional regulator with XRE-family HTH domain
MFGRLLAGHRRQRGLTQEELAARTGLSVRAIRDVESGRVRRPRSSSVRLLADAFGLTDVERDQFVRQADGAQAAVHAGGASTGRDGAEDRPATEVVDDLAGGFPPGMWAVELAAVTRPDLVAATVATALGLRGHPHRPPVEVLTEYLRTRRVLLVLNNCECLAAE